MYLKETVFKNEQLGYKLGDNAVRISGKRLKHRIFKELLQLKNTNDIV